MRIVFDTNDNKPSGPEWRMWVEWKDPEGNDHRYLLSSSRRQFHSIDEAISECDHITELLRSPDFQIPDVISKISTPKEPQLRKDIYE